MKKSPFFDFLNRRDPAATKHYLSPHFEDVHFIDWNDYLLPLDYGDAQAEYRAIRDSCGVFDISPLRKYRIRGPDAGDFLDHLLTRPASATESMRGIYVAFCNEDGTLKDDAILHKYAADDYLLLPSDMDHSVHFDGLHRQLGIGDLNITDSTESRFGLAVQGPLSATVLHHMGFEDIQLLDPSALREFAMPCGTLLVARMGFTADLGYEIWCEPEQAGFIQETLASARTELGIDIPGYGLTALDTCRLEGGFIVAGWDCATEADPNPGFERSPFELGLGWLVDLDAVDFVGRQALLAQQSKGGRYTLRSFTMDDPRKPQDGAELFASMDGEEPPMGLINCSAWSWDLGRMIGNASIDHRYAQASDAIVHLQGEAVPVSLSQGPLRRFDRHRQIPAAIETTG